MARNRKRAKERRARRTDSGNGSRPRRAGGREAAREPFGGPEAARQPFDPSDPFVPSDELEAPSPIEHASADAELAEEAIAFGPAETDVLGAPETKVEQERDARVEQERLEEELAEERQERAATAASAVTHERPGLIARLIGFLQGSWRELQRVQWPDRRQVAQATGVVLGFVIVAGVFLGLCDLAFSHLMNYILK